MARPLTLFMKVFSLLGLFFMLGACSTRPASEPVVIQGTAVPPLPTLDPALVADGSLLYGEHCAACHGAALEGKPDWKTIQADGSYPAPPHDSTGHTWHHPDELLLDIIANGGDVSLGSTMPAFSEQLNELQVRAILEYIKSYWGEEEREFQWWITVR